MKRRYPPQATLTTLPGKHIDALVHRFGEQHPLPKRRGRPPSTPKPSASPCGCSAHANTPPPDACASRLPPNASPTAPCLLWAPSSTDFITSQTNGFTRCWVG